MFFCILSYFISDMIVIHITVAISQDTLYCVIRVACDRPVNVRYPTFEFPTISKHPRYEDIIVISYNSRSIRVRICVFILI